MTTPKKHTSTKSHAPSPAADARAPLAPVASAAAAGPSPSPSETQAAALVSFASPPPVSTIPTTPAGYVAATTPQFRGVLPQQAEQTALEAALKDLQRIPNYALFVGAPPLAHFIQLLTLGGQWTEMRNASFKWDQFAATQEGNVWTTARPQMEEFRGAFAQAQKADPSLAAKLPGLVAFLGVRSAVAQKGATTKRANAKAEAEGKRPIHGQVGKRRQRAAANAALAEADAKTNGTNGQTPAEPTPVPAPATASATPGAPKP